MLSTALAIGALTAQADLITNGGFEELAITPWSAGGIGGAVSISATARGGSQSAQYDFPASGLININQNVAIDPEDRLLTYTLTCSVNVEGYSEVFGIRPTIIERGGSAVNHFGAQKWITAGTQGWVRVQQDFVMTKADATSFDVLFYFYQGGGTAGSVLIDDVSLELAVDDPNLLLNGGFEDATASASPWTTGGPTPGAVSISNVAARSGSLSAEFDFSANLDHIKQVVTITPADRENTYTLSLSLNVEETGYANDLGILPTVFEDGVAHFGTKVWIPAGTLGWVTVSQDFTLTKTDASTFTGQFYFYPAGGLAGSVLIDNASLELAVDDPNLLSNGGFEDATASISPWVTAGAGVTAAGITNVASVGSQAAALDVADTAAGNGIDGNISQVVSVTAADLEKTYTLSCSINIEGYSEAFKIRPSILEGGAHNHFGALQTIPSGTTGWVTINQDVTVTHPTTTSWTVIFYLYPQGDLTTTGTVLLDNIILELAPVSFPEVANNSELLVNGGFTQVENENPVGGVLGNSYTVDGSLSDWSGFWGSSATLTGWAHYHEDPNNLGALIGTVNSGPDAGFLLDGTDKLNTDFNTASGILNLNSSGSYRNGMRQALDGLTIDTSLTYVLSIVAKKNANHDHSSASFSYALTTGADEATAINFANVVPGTAVQHISSGALPTDYGAPLVLYVSGADLQAADTAGTVNVIMQNLNTEAANTTPTDAGNVSQVTISNVSLAYSIPNGDVNKDGKVDNDDVTLANSYLDGSVDGGDDAATRLATRMAQGYSLEEAMALLNLTDFDTDGDGTFAAADVTVIDDLATALAGAGDPISSDAGFNVGDEFEIVVDGLVENNTYYLKRTGDLADGYIIIDSVEAAATTETFTDTAPLADKAFYQVTD